MANNTTAYKFRDAIRHALANYEDKKGKIEKGDVLRHIAINLIRIALKSGEQNALAAIKELADRLDGKAVQAIVGPEGEPITVIQRIIVQHAVESEEDITLPIEGDEVKLIN